MIKKQIVPMMMMAAATAAAAQGTLNSGIERSNMNLEVKPGTDFFEYAAGGWMKAHPLTAEFSRYSQFDALQEVNQQQMQDLINGLSTQKQQKGSLGQKIGDLYNLAMDSVRLNKEGWGPLKSRLAMVDAVADKAELMVVIAQLRRIGVPTMFGVYCGADIKDSEKNLVHIVQSGLSMGNRDYYLNDDEPTLKIRNAYKDYVKKLFVMVGNDGVLAEKKMQSVLGIETRIAGPSYSSTQLRDVEGNYHKMTYGRLLSDYSGIDWGTFLWQLGYPAVSDVCVSQPEPIHEVEKIWAEASLEDLKAYTTFKLVNDAASYLDDQFRAVYFDFYSRTMSGAQQDRPRWKRAVGVVEAVLGEAVGKLYVEKYFPESSKKRMLELVKNLQTALGERILAQEWMSDETKRQALEKLDAFYVKIGYPDKWMDYSGLVIDDNLSFYENLCRASEFLHLHLLVLL